MTELLNGTYRRIYSGAIRGRRINSVTLEAEACFWRMNMVADDWGNLEVTPDLLIAQAFTRRLSTTPEQVAAWLDELVGAGLIVLYDDRGEHYAHIVDFEKLQPAGRNGRRIARFPRFMHKSVDLGNPGESKASDSPKGESGGIRVNPENPVDNKNKTKIKTSTTNKTVPAPERLREKTKSPTDDVKNGFSVESCTGTGSDQAPDAVSCVVDQSSGDPATDEGIQTSGAPESIQDAPAARPTRYSLKLRWLESVAPLVGREGATRHPPKSPKFNRDRVAVEAWFDEWIWPEDDDKGEDARHRLEQLITLSKQAMASADNPIAWLTPKVKSLRS